MAADTLIVTPLGLERRAVRQHLTDVEELATSSLSLDLGRYRTAVGSEIVEVAVLETGPGNVDAAVLTLTALHQLPQVRTVIACGVAGGYKDVQIGDVVASSKVYWIEAGKETDDGFRARPNFGHVSPLMIQHARQVAIDARWQGRSHVPVPDAFASGRPATAVVGPIAVLESVVGSRETETGSRLAEHFGDALAVDMEGFGILKAAEATDRVAGLEIRGVSDLLGGKGAADAAGSQDYAAAQAAAFAFEVIGSLRRAAPTRQDDEWWRTLADVAARTYPAGLRDRAIWTRAGGDLAAVDLAGPAVGQWHDAIRQVRHGGGGGSGFSVEGLLDTMLQDHPQSAELTALATGSI